MVQGTESSSHTAHELEPDTLSKWDSPADASDALREAPTSSAADDPTVSIAPIPPVSTSPRSETHDPSIFERPTEKRPTEKRPTEKRPADGAVTIVRHRPQPRGKWVPHSPTGDFSDWTTVWFTYERLPKAREEFRGVLPRRWVVERTIAWIGKNRRMSKDYECQPASSGAWVYLSMIRVMLKRLACEQAEPAFHYRRVA